MPTCFVGDMTRGPSLAELTVAHEYMRQTVIDESERNPQYAARCAEKARQLMREIDAATWFNSGMETEQ